MRLFYIAIILHLFLSCTTVCAQQDPLLNLYSYTSILHNPAYAGYGEQSTATIGARDQWIGFKGTPFTTFASYDHYLHRVNSGIGLYMMYDDIGLQTTSMVGLPYSYKIQFKDSIHVRLGTQVSIYNKKINGFDFESFGNSVDPSIPTGAESWTYVDFNFGAWLTLKDFYLGASVKHVGSTEPTVSNYYSSNRINSYLIMGIRVGEEDELVWEPSLIVRDHAPTNLHGELTNRFIYKNTYHLGMSISISSKKVSSVTGMAGARINDQFELMTAYSYPLNGLQGFTYGSLELLIRYQFKTVNRSLH